MRLTKQTLDVRTLGGVYGTGVLTPDGATGILANQTCQIFQDQLGAGTTSNLVQTNADSNLSEAGSRMARFIPCSGFKFSFNGR